MFPILIPVHNAGGSSSAKLAMTVTVEGLRAGISRITERASNVHFQNGRRLGWDVKLLPSCLDISCSATETCVDGGCVDAAATKIVDWTTADAGIGVALP